ncbi:MAG: protein kinase [Elusimicrobiota bacterium]
MRDTILSIAAMLLFAGASPGVCASSSQDDQKKAAEEARKRYEAMIQGLCASMDGNIGSAEQQRDAIVDFARTFETVSGAIQHAWDAMDVVFTDLEGANSANDQARAMVQPEANLNNAGYMVQDSRKEMFTVAQMLNMNTQELFGFAPPADWNGANPGEKPIGGLDPKGVQPGSGSGSAGTKPADSGFPPLTGAGGKSTGGQVPGGTGLGQGSGPEGGSGLTRTSGLPGASRPGSGTAAGEGGGVLLRGRSVVEGGSSAGQLAAMGGFASASGAQTGPPYSREGRPIAARRGARAEAEGGQWTSGEAPVTGPSFGSSRRMDKAMSKGASDAWSLNLAGRYHEAEDAARDAIRRNPNDHDAYEALAWAELRQGRYRDSERDATQAIAIDSRSARAYRIRAFARQMLGDRAGMLRDIEMAAKLDPDYEDEAEIARRGGDIYDPTKGDAELLYHHRRQPFDRKDARDLTLLTLGAAAAAALALWLRRRKKSAAPALKPAPSAAPAVLDAYELKKELGRSRGSVLLARDKALGRSVVVRRTRVPDPRERALLLAAGKAAARLEHPVWVSIYEVCEEGDGVCMVCERVAGRTLRDIAAKGGADPRRLFQVLARACEPLPAAHAAGLSHGRIHLGNIFVTEGGEVKVADFGTLIHPAGAAQDVADLGRCLKELADAAKEPLPEGVEAILARSSEIKSAQEFLDLLRGV